MATDNPIPRPSCAYVGVIPRSVQKLEPVDLKDVYVDVAPDKTMIAKLRWIWVLRGFFEEAANGFWEGLGVDELTDFGGDFFRRVEGVV